MRKPLIVVKLGGSALTDKKRKFTPRIGEIHRAAKQIALLGKRFSIVVVHGAGSYGHIPVKYWGLESGFRNRGQVKGLVATKSRLLEWEVIFSGVFLKHHVPLLPIVASDFIVARNGRISSADLRPVRNWLSMGCIPSTGGDIVCDLNRGFSVVSGDQIAAYLAVKLQASKLIFGVDVDGVYSANPKLDRHARIMTELTPREAMDAVRHAGELDTPDVTGGMAGKIREAIPAASNGIPVYFVNLTKGNRITKAVLNQKVKSSKILPSN